MHHEDSVRSGFKDYYKISQQGQVFPVFFFSPIMFTLVMLLPSQKCVISVLKQNKSRHSGSNQWLMLMLVKKNLQLIQLANELFEDDKVADSSLKVLSSKEDTTSLVLAVGVLMLALVAAWDLALRLLNTGLCCTDHLYKYCSECSPLGLLETFWLAVALTHCDFN